MCLRLSIIIPIFNSENTIEKMLSSLLSLKSNSIEIILIDDGSTDNSADICMKHANRDNRITVLQKENSGVSDARNLGLEYAHGEYVYFCDSDDYVITEVLDKANKELDINADIYFFDYVYRILETNKISKSTFSLKNNVVLDKEYIISHILSPLVLKEGTDMASLWHKIFKREIIQKYKIRFDEEIHRGEDWRFILDFLSVAETAYYVPETLYEYRLDGSQKESKYKVETGIAALGSVKRKLKLNEQFSLGANEAQLLLWYCAVIEQIIISINQKCDDSVLLEMLMDPIVQKAADALTHYSGKELVALEVPRKYKIYSRMISKKMYRSFLVLCKRLEK